VAAWTRPHPAARLLALAYMVERCIESGELRDYREPAERLGMSRAQMANVAGLLALAPEIQERIVMGAAAPTTSCLRRLAGVPVWSDQVALLPDGGCNS
jgi:hypothetical protein